MIEDQIQYNKREKKQNWNLKNVPKNPINSQDPRHLVASTWTFMCVNKPDPSRKSPLTAQKSGFWRGKYWLLQPMNLTTLSKNLPNPQPTIQN